MKVKKLNEGTWAIPFTYEERKEKGKVYITKIEELKKEISSIFGDDILFDGLDGAIIRINELIEISQDQIG